MTSLAMIAGMIPMAIGLGEAGEQTASLGRAVIGGLGGATCATLLVLPATFTMLARKSGVASVSLDPDDPHSGNFDPANAQAAGGDQSGLLRGEHFAARER
jgi:AcrB/AcrD/AcrF family